MIIEGSFTWVGVLWNGWGIYRTGRKDYFGGSRFSRGLWGRRKVAWQRKRGRGIRTQNLTPPSQATSSLHFCILLAGIISSLELSQALTSRSYDEKSGSVLKATDQGYKAQRGDETCSLEYSVQSTVTDMNKMCLLLRHTEEESAVWKGPTGVLTVGLNLKEWAEQLVYRGGIPHGENRNVHRHRAAKEREEYVSVV